MPLTDTVSRQIHSVRWEMTKKVFKFSLMILVLATTILTYRNNITAALYGHSRDESVVETLIEFDHVESNTQTITNGMDSKSYRPNDSRTRNETFPYIDSTVVIIHDSDGDGDGQPSLGTITGNGNTLITHNHFSDPLDPNDPNDVIWVKDKNGSGNVVQTQFTNPTSEFQTTVIDLPDGMMDVTPAPEASQSVKSALQPGDLLDVVYMDSDGKLVSHAYTIQNIQDGVITIYNDDPNFAIFQGSSGGGAFYNNELIGNTWAIQVEFEFFEGNKKFLQQEIYIVINPPQLSFEELERESQNENSPYEFKALSSNCVNAIRE